MGTSKYKYYYRPAYGSSEMLIEFFYGVEDSCFIKDVLIAIDTIDPKIESEIDLWQNDEVLYPIDSVMGSFILSRSTWGLAFIAAKENQSAIAILDRILGDNPIFDRVAVSHNKYL